MNHHIKCRVNMTPTIHTQTNTQQRNDVTTHHTVDTDEN